MSGTIMRTLTAVVHGRPFNSLTTCWFFCRRGERACWPASCDV